MTNKTECRYFDTCSAPLCPMDNSPAGVWFPGEPICKMKQVPDWVKRQRKIDAKNKNRGLDAGCYTKRMLNRNFIVTAKTDGLDPDKGTPEWLESVWLKKHPEIQKTEKQMEHAKKLGQSQMDKSVLGGVGHVLNGTSEKKMTPSTTQAELPLENAMERGV